MAFMSVTLGILLGHWLVASTHTGWSIPLTTNAATLPALLGLSIAKLTLGVAVLLGYRLLAKQLMHLVLPGIIALSNKAGLDFSRRHYLPSQFVIQNSLLSAVDGMLTSLSSTARTKNRMRRRRHRYFIPCRL